MEKHIFAGKVIDALGGTRKTSKICEVADSSVTEWRYSGIPRARLMFLRLAHPEVFVGELSENPANGGEK